MSHFAKRFWPPRFFSKAYWGTGEATPGEVTLSGQQANTAGGVLGVVVEILLVGQAATGQGGVLSPDLGEGVTLTGQQAVAGFGTLAPVIEVGLQGTRVVVSGGAFFGVQHVTEADLFALLVTPEIALVTGVDSFLVVVIEPTLTALVIDVSLEAADKSDDLWAQQQVDELFATTPDNELAVFTED